MRRAAAAALSLALLSGCGGASSEAALDDLRTRVARIRAAVAAADERAAGRELAGLGDAVGVWHERGALDEREAGEILAAAARVLSALPEIRPAPTPTQQIRQEHSDEPAPERREPSKRKKRERKSDDDD